MNITSNTEYRDPNLKQKAGLFVGLQANSTGVASLTLSGTSRVGWVMASPSHGKKWAIWLAGMMHQGKASK